MDKHELIAAVTALASELGRSPTRAEFAKSIRGGDYKIKHMFGNYSVLLQAAGLDTYTERRKQPKIGNSVFERDLERHLEQFVPREQPTRAPYPRLAAISDIHWPFSSARVVEAFLRWIEREQPSIVLINGDAWDMYSHAKFPRSHNVFTPREEERLARAANEQFWKDVKALVPKADCYQLLGNHDVRPMKRILEVYPEAEDWIAERLKQLFTFEGVKTIHDAREELMFGDVMVHHGYRSKLGDHRDYALLNSINGHTHRGGSVFRRIRGQVLWELNCGLAGDPEAKGLTYTSQKINDWTPGFGWLDQWGPRFICA